MSASPDAKVCIVQAGPFDGPVARDRWLRDNIRYLKDPYAVYAAEPCSLCFAFVHDAAAQRFAARHSDRATLLPALPPTSELLYQQD